MKTDELIDWLKEIRISKYCWYAQDRRVVNEIIKRLEELDWFREEKKAEDATWK